MPRASGLYHVRPTEDAAQPVSDAHQTARGVPVHAKLDPGQDGADTTGPVHGPAHQRRVQNRTAGLYSLVGPGSCSSNCSGSCGSSSGSAQ